MTPRRALATVLVAAMTLLPACGTGAEEPPRGTGGEATGSPSADTVPPPGVYEMPDGRVRVVGTLLYLELEGGFWAVTDVQPGAEPSPEDTADVVAVIPNAEEVRPDVGDLLGEYVAVTGQRLEGPSIRQAGPEVEAESIDPIEAP